MTPAEQERARATAWGNYCESEDVHHHICQDREFVEMWVVRYNTDEFACGHHRAEPLYDAAALAEQRESIPVTTYRTARGRAVVTVNHLTVFDGEIATAEALAPAIAAAIRRGDG